MLREVVMLPPPVMLLMRMAWVGMFSADSMPAVATTMLLYHNFVMAMLYDGAFVPALGVRCARK